MGRAPSRIPTWATMERTASSAQAQAPVGAQARSADTCPGERCAGLSPRQNPTCRLNDPAADHGGFIGSCSSRRSRSGILRSTISIVTSISSLPSGPPRKYCSSAPKAKALAAEHVEPLRVVENLGVPAGGPQERDDGRARRDVLPAELDVGGGGPPHRVRGFGEAEELLRAVVGQLKARGCSTRSWSSSLIRPRGYAWSTRSVRCQGTSCRPTATGPTVTWIALVGLRGSVGRLRA